jgi:hypothetical protein
MSLHCVAQRLIIDSCYCLQPQSLGASLLDAVKDEQTGNDGVVNWSRVARLVGRTREESLQLFMALTRDETASIWSFDEVRKAIDV